MRLALSKASDHKAQQIDGKLPEEYRKEISRRSGESEKVVQEELRVKYKIEPSKLLSARSKTNVEQLFCCYKLHPPVQCGGSDMFVSINESNENMGLVALKMLDRPYMRRRNAVKNIRSPQRSCLFLRTPSLMQNFNYAVY
ncbi:hypothetical protein [Gluconobacter roseus]|uniref:hypothetical protein n=1 Tax=Gluconobacter roseus TaxID=586239 RepID=UPI0038CFCDA9